MHLTFQLPLNTSPSTSGILRLGRRGSIIPLRLQSYECHFNWAKHYPLKFEEISHGVLLLEEKFRDESSEIDLFFEKPPPTGSTYFILLTATKLTQAHFNIEIGKFSEAKNCLAEAENFLSRYCSSDNNDDDNDEGVPQENSARSGATFPPEYGLGFTYILEGIKVFLEIQINRGSETPTAKVATASKLRTSKVSLDGLKHFKLLPAKAKYIVWTVRDVFFSYCFRSNVRKPNWMESILEMEPYIPKWHFYLYRALHGVRKLIPRPVPVLLLEEGKQERIVTSWSGISEPIVETDTSPLGRSGAKKNPSRRHEQDFLGLSYQAMCITEIFLERRTPPEPAQTTTDPSTASTPSPVNQYPWRFGKMLFDNPMQVLAVIHEKTTQILELDCHLDGVYLNFSEIHMFRLPPPHQDMELALRCLKKAIRLNNTNPKTHYRMGLAYFKLENYEQAIPHFREAIKNPNNIGAFFGLLQLLLSNPHENEVEIQSILRYAMKNKDLTKVWDKRCLRTLHYLKGCFHFMQQEKDIEEAITSWIIAHDNESLEWSYYFHNLSHQCSIFNWPTKRLNLSNVSAALKHVAYLERTQFRQLLLDICSEVDDAIRQDERKNSNIYQ